VLNISIGGVYRQDGLRSVATEHVSPNQELRARAVDAESMPRLWKAQCAFVSAEILRQENNLDCAANRYYYALLHAARQCVGEDEELGEELDHGGLVRLFTKRYDDQAWPAITRAQMARNRGDYTPHPVRDATIASLVMPVARVLLRVMDRLGISREGAT